MMNYNPKDRFRCGKCGRFSTKIYTNSNGSLHICTYCNLQYYTSDCKWNKEEWVPLIETTKQKYITRNLKNKSFIIYPEEWQVDPPLPKLQ